jgi:hypothetical protein
VARFWPVAAVYAVLAGVAPVVGFGAGIPWRLSLAASAACLLVGLGQAGRAALALARRRRTADRLLRTGVKVHPHSELLTWRAAELTSARNRSMLARSLRGLVQEVERPSFVTAVPLNRRGLRPQLPLVRSLAARIANVDRAVAPRGMVLVEELLTDGFTSPLYVGGRTEDVSRSIERCLVALDGDGVAARLRERAIVEFTSRPGRRARVHTGGGLR